MTEAKPGWTFEELYAVTEHAYVLHAEGQDREAAIIFEGLLTIDSRNVYCRDALCAVYLALDQPEEAVRHASILLGTHPRHQDAIARRCEAYLRLDRIADAERDLQTLKEVHAAIHVRRLQLRLAVAKRKRLTA